jgi:hypothetical protein
MGVTLHHCMLFAVDGSKEKQKLLPLRAHLQPGRGQRGEAFISTMGPRASTCNDKLISCRKRRPMSVKHAGGQCMGSGQHGDGYSTYQHARGRHGTDAGSHGSHFCLTASLCHGPAWRPKKTARIPLAAQEPCEAPTPPPERSQRSPRSRRAKLYFNFVGWY